VMLLDASVSLKRHWLVDWEYEAWHDNKGDVIRC
jgi:hypothetical protein